MREKQWVMAPQLTMGTEARQEGGSKLLMMRSGRKMLRRSPCTRPPAQCFNYQELNSPTRKSSYTQTTSFSDTSAYTRDWKNAQWYRVTGGAGTKLADTEVAERHCGVIYPGWIIGGHPSVSQGEVSRRISFQNGGSMTAKIINCGPFYVYHLISPGKRFGYCTV